MGAACCKQADFEEQPVRKSFHGGMDTSLHGNLIRHRTKKEFDQIYERVEELGSVGICKVFKIRKVVHGGSASTTYVLRQQRGLKANMNPEVRKARRRELSTLQNLEVYLALKEINLTMVHEDQIAPLKNEVELLKLLDHPNIIRVFETYEFNDGSRNSIGVIMELCTGGDLHARMPYSEQEVARITKQILHAVSYMHDRHVTHRDLKLENILFENLDPEACIKVIDFGLSKRYSPTNNILTERVGTLYSMSPETMKGIYTSQADVWSTGVITFTLLSGGEKPFQAQTPKQLIAKVLTGDFSFEDPVWNSVSENAKTFLESLLQVIPDNRLSARDALQHPWLSEEGIENLSTIKPDSALVRKVQDFIVQYAELSDFKKVALNVIAKKSNFEEIVELRKIFDEYDSLKVGAINLEEMRVLLARFNFSEEKLKEIFDKLDVNHDNVINYTEFIAATLECNGKIQEHRLAEAFDQLDGDCTGYINRDDLRQIFGPDCTDAYIDQVLAEVDSDGDGQVDYHDFLKAFSEQRRAGTGLAEIDEGNEDEAAVNDVLTEHGFLEGTQ